MEPLSDDEADDVLRLLDEVTAVDGFSPLSDPVVAALRRREPGTHLTQHRDGRLVGYGNVASGEHPIAELIVEPGIDPRGLLSVIVDTAGPGLRIWTKGDAAALNDVLPGLGFTLQRTLVKLHRPLDDPPLAEPMWAPGVTVRTFEVGTDEAAWLEVNNAAFVGHPEQSGWTTADIKVREQEPWFRADGFFLAEFEGKLAGFHWTKIHAGPTPYGEVYVIGVAPGMQGKRLGEALLLHGLRHLRDQGLAMVVLYVEADNTSANALYERLGFTRWSADRLYAR